MTVEWASQALRRRWAHLPEGKRSLERADTTAFYDAQPTVTRCALCRDRIIHKGTAENGRKAFLRHMEDKHT